MSEWLHRGPRSWCFDTLIGWVLLPRLGNILNITLAIHSNFIPLTSPALSAPGTDGTKRIRGPRCRVIFSSLRPGHSLLLPPICYSSGFPWPNRIKPKCLHQPDLDPLLQLSSSSSLHQPSLPHPIPRRLCIHKHSLPSLPLHPESIFLHCSVSWKPAEVLSTQSQWPGKPGSWKKPVLGSKALISWSDPNALWAALGQRLGLIVSVCGPHSV